MAILDKQHAKDMLKSAKEKTASFIQEDGKELFTKASKTIADASTKVAEKTTDIYSAAKGKAEELVEDLKQQEREIKEIGYSEKAIQTTKEMITKLSNIPVVRVDRDEFLKKTFGDSPHIDDILKYGPQYVYSTDSLRAKADEIIQNSTRKSTVASFAAGLPSNIAVTVAASVADIGQYFAFALNMAQKIAYLFGENQLFTTFDPKEDMLKTDGTSIPESAQERMIAYLGAMLGVSGAGALIVKTAQSAGAAIGKKVASQALTKTTWYPLLKKVASVLGYKITKKTVESAITKTVPVIGGAVSGAITYASFKPMGGRLADVFVKMLNGEFNVDMELNSEYADKINSEANSFEVSEDEIIDAEFIDLPEHDSSTNSAI